MVTALPVYEMLNLYPIKNESDRYRNNGINRKPRGFLLAGKGASKKETNSQRVYTPKLAFERSLLQNNIRQASLQLGDLDEIRQNIKMCRYRNGKNKSLFVQKQLGLSLDIESAIERIDKINVQNDNEEKSSVQPYKMKCALGYNNFKRGNYDIYSIRKVDILVG